MSELYWVSFRTPRHRLIAGLYLMSNSTAAAIEEARRRSRIEADIAPRALPVHPDTARKIPPRYRNRFLSPGECMAVDALVI